MTNACTIEVKRLDDGNFRATCALYPDAQSVAATAEAARSAFEKFIAEQVRRQQGIAHEEPAR
jgi:hypothetical protein